MSCNCKKKKVKRSYSQKTHSRHALTERQKEAYNLLKGTCGEYDYDELADLLDTTPQAAGRILENLSRKKNISCNTVYDSQGNDWEYYSPRTR